MGWRCFLLFLAASPVFAVERSKFRTCAQGSFCRRYRKYVKHVETSGEYAHVIDPESIVHEGHVVRAHLIYNPQSPPEVKVDGDVAGDEDAAKVAESGDAGELTKGDVDSGASAEQDPNEVAKTEASAALVVPQPLSLVLAFYEGSDGKCGVIRITIDEQTPLYQRFRLPEGDVVSTDLRPDPVVSRSAGGVTLVSASAPGGCTVTLHHAPFEVEVSAGGRVLQHLNSRHLMNFERYRAREDQASLSPLADATTIDASDLWEEVFKEPGGGGQRFLDSKPRGPAAVGIDVTFVDAPITVGLAEHATHLHLAEPNFTEPYRLFNLDVFEYDVDVPMGLYGNIPMVTAIHQWPKQAESDSATATGASGFLVVNPSEGFVKVDGPEVDELSDDMQKGDTKTWWLFESGILDMFSFAGPTPDAVLRQYHTVTSLPRMPPLASLGKHQSRWNYVDVEDALQVNKDFDKHRIPYDFLWLDLEHTDGKKYFTWEPKHFAEPGRIMDALAASQRKLVTIVDPHIKGDPDYPVFAKLEAADAFVRDANGSSFEGFCWPGPSRYPDFCDPKTRNVWAHLFALDAYPHSRPDLFTWNDMNEPSVFDGPEVTMPRDNLHRCHSETYDVEHRDVHNMYGAYVHAASVEGQLLRAPDVRPLVLTRSFFAGSHRHGPLWTGDNLANWDHLARSVPMLVSLALCGLSFAGADVPGFFGDPDDELYVRWHQLGIWYPFYRAHAHLTTKRREPWVMGPAVESAVRDAVITRYQLLPMWYTLIADWSLLGSPVMRPLWYHDLGDAQAYRHTDDHFFVGEALVVRAVDKPGAKAAKVYLPPGEWFDFWDQAAAPRAGGEVFEHQLRGDSVPVFARAGHILPMKMRPRRSSGPMARDPITLVVFGAVARGRVYVDDGHSQQFLQGSLIYDELEFDGVALKGRPALQGASRNPPAVPQAGLRVERLVLVGLRQQPSAARVVRAAGADVVLQVTSEAMGDSGLWRSVVKDPAVHIGTSDWQVKLEF